MIAFHTFLNNYRQTPRSRFIRKYKPQQDPIYEEISAFERSYLSSQVGGTLAVPPDIENMAQLLEKNNLDTSNSMKVISMYMAKSSINYDEYNNRFEEHFEPIVEYP